MLSLKQADSASSMGDGVVIESVVGKNKTGLMLLLYCAE